ncbi:Uncharacterised protein [Mycobacteroides abscessus subsp. abscessus]|nr:Uncharacterised protein [Mycobacteroides abscessus subsp. abscessus]
MLPLSGGLLPLGCNRIRTGLRALGRVLDLGRVLAVGGETGGGIVLSIRVGVGLGPDLLPEPLVQGLLPRIRRDGVRSGLAQPAGPAGQVGELLLDLVQFLLCGAALILGRAHGLGPLGRGQALGALAVLGLPGAQVLGPPLQDGVLPGGLQRVALPGRLLPMPGPGRARGAEGLLQTGCGLGQTPLGPVDPAGRLLLPRVLLFPRFFSFLRRLRLGCLPSGRAERTGVIAVLRGQEAALPLLQPSELGQQVLTLPGGIGQLLPGGPRLLLQHPLRFRVQVRWEQPPQQLLAVRGGGLQELGEATLREHDHLGELLTGQADGLGQVLTGLIHPGGDHLPLGLRIRLGTPAHQHRGVLLDVAGLRPGRGPVPGGAALHEVAVLSDAHLHLHRGLGRGLGEMRFQALGVLRDGGRAVQGEGERLEHRGFAGARGPGEQEEPGLVQRLEVDLLGLPVRAEGLQSQPVDPHARFPSVASVASASCACSSRARSRAPSTSRRSGSSRGRRRTCS